MNKTTPIVPAGANELVVAISSLCEEKNAYKHCGIKPPHYVVSLDAGNGQTTVVRYIADVMLNNDIRSFRGMDQYLEYRLDGSMDQLKQVFGDIGSCAVYTNSFEGIVSLDLCALSAYINEAQCDYLISEVSKLCDTVTFIYFIGNNPSRGMLALIEKLRKVTGDMEMITIPPYSVEDLAIIAERSFDEHGVSFESSEEFHETLTKILDENSCKTVKDTTKMVEKIIKKADFSGYIPLVSIKELMIFSSENKERGEAR